MIPRTGVIHISNIQYIFIIPLAKHTRICKSKELGEWRGSHLTMAQYWPLFLLLIQRLWTAPNQTHFIHLQNVWLYLWNFINLLFHEKPMAIVTSGFTNMDVIIPYMKNDLSRGDPSQVSVSLIHSDGQWVTWARGVHSSWQLGLSINHSSDLIQN